MKQKYVILKNDGDKEITIQEFAELDKDMMSLLCEQKYSFTAIKAAIKKSKEDLIGIIRTPNMYPSQEYVERLADSITALFGPENADSTEIFCDDLELLSNETKHQAAQTKAEENDSGIDEILSEEFDSNYSEKDDLDTLKAPLKIVDDESINVKDDS